MDLISLKYWHWIVLGIIAGGMLGFAWTGFEPTMPRSGSLADFKVQAGNVGEVEPVKDLPRIANVTILAPDVDPQGKTVYPITFDRLGTNKDGKAVYQPQSLYVTQPFDEGKTLAQFLDDRKVSYADRTGAAKYMPVGYGMAVGIVGIGLIWPTMIRLLVGAGFAEPKPKEPERQYATGEQDDGTTKPKKRFAGFGFGGSGEKTADPFAAKPAADPFTEVDPSTLFASTGKGAQEHRVAAPAKEEEKKSYGGEYYPVAKAVVKKDDKPK